MVAHAEVEPVHVSPGVAIHSQKAVKLSLLDLYHTVEVPSLEHAIEGVLILDVEGGVHPLEGPVEQVVLVEAVPPQPLLHEV